MSATPTEVGKILEGREERDAIHIAVAPVEATEILRPGDPIGFTFEGNTEKVSYQEENSIGIVDPFLKKQVRCGDKFWMFLNPNTITSLKHNWTHPSFKEQEVVRVEKEYNPSKTYLEDFALEAGIDYDQLLEAAHAYLSYDDYLIDGGRWEGQYVPDIFWEHFGNVTGRKSDKKGSFFSCSC